MLYSGKVLAQSCGGVLAWPWSTRKLEDLACPAAAVTSYTRKLEDLDTAVTNYTRKLDGLTCPAPEHEKTRGSGLHSPGARENWKIETIQLITISFCRVG